MELFFIILMCMSILSIGFGLGRIYEIKQRKNVILHAKGEIPVKHALEAVREMEGMQPLFELISAVERGAYEEGKRNALDTKQHQ